MEIPNKNQQDTLPYEKLALLGIDREKADMLPQDVKQKLMQGEVTPLLQVSIDTGNGMVISLPLKLQLAADKGPNYIKPNAAEGSSPRRRFSSNLFSVA